MLTKEVFLEFIFKRGQNFFPNNVENPYAVHEHANALFDKKAIKLFTFGALFMHVWDIKDKFICSKLNFL